MELLKTNNKMHDVNCTRASCSINSASITFSDTLTINEALKMKMRILYFWHKRKIIPRNRLKWNSLIGKTRATHKKKMFLLNKYTLQPVDLALTEAKLDKTKIDDIVLVGGLTRIPTVRLRLQNFFNSKQLNLSINSDEAVSCSAVIQAAILSGHSQR